MASKDEGPASSLDDVPALLASIHRGSALAHEISARRPQRQLLGEHLVSFIEALQLHIEHGRLEGTMEDIALRPADEEALGNRYYWKPWIPRAVSTCREELGELNSRGWPVDLLTHQPEEDFGRPLFLVRRLFESALDHLRGIGLLLQADGITRSPMALGRVALESASRAWYLLDPAISGEQRMWRALNAELDVLSEAETAARR